MNVLKIFNCRKSEQIKTKYDLIKYVVSQFNNISNCEFFNSKRTTVNSQKERLYSLNLEEIRQHIVLYKKRMITASCIDENIFKVLNIEMTPRPTSSAVVVTSMAPTLNQPSRVGRSGRENW